MVVSAQNSSISTNQHSFLSSVADTVLVGHPYGTYARDRSCHTTGAGQGGAELKIFGAEAPWGSHFPRGRGGAGRGVHPWYIYQHEARVVTRSFDVCLNSNVDDTNTMAMQGNKDVVFPRTSVMNARAVCSIDFNSKLQIETSDENPILT